MIEENKKTKDALLNPKKGDIFSEMLHYWCCVISVNGGRPKCIEGNSNKFCIRQYESCEELEQRYRYQYADGHWISYFGQSESLLDGMSKEYIDQQESIVEKREAMLEIIF